ncbi:MAG: type II toxin-antitoxin system RelE/ParE family toxin [Clostridia bacterium]|nr:type II toxin-antitoxin system RelE/ParE family toxin [Clostridia bacterium]
MSFKLKYSKRFTNDVNHALDYIEYTLENPIAADKLAIEIDEKIHERLEAPNLYLKYELLNSNKFYYRLYIKNYIVFYTVEEDVMRVRRFLYNRRDFDKIDVMS